MHFQEFLIICIHKLINCSSCSRSRGICAHNTAQLVCLFAAVNGLTSRRPSLVRCVRRQLCAPCLDWLSTARCRDSVCFSVSGRGSPRCPQTRLDTKFRGCSSLPGVVQHLPVAVETVSEGEITIWIWYSECCRALCVMYCNQYSYLDLFT